MSENQNNSPKPDIHTTNPKDLSNQPNQSNPSKIDDSLHLHIDEEQQDHFVLNLKNYDLHVDTPLEKAKTSLESIGRKTSAVISNTANQTIQKTSSIDFSKLRKVSNQPKTPKSPVWENLKFAFNTVLIFLVTFVALNWGAYKQVFVTYYNQFIGNTDTTLQVFSNTNSNKGDSNIVYASSSIINDNLNIPKLNREITPPGTRIIIPSINTNVPVIDVPEDKLIERNWTALENEIQNALRSGVVHYPGTPLPGQSGNVVITGHSSYYPWDPGRFKDVFAVLHNLKEGDEIIIFHRQQKYTYRVGEIRKVFPYEVDVLNDFKDDRLTLITCTPIGTNLRRLIITAFPV